MVVVGIAWNGAASLEPRVLMHLLLLGGLALAATLPRERLAEGGTAVRLALPAIAVLLAGLAALVPLPPAVLAALSPGTSLALPESLHGAALQPTDVLTGLGVAVLVAGTAALTGMAVRPARRRGIRIERVAAVAVLVIVALALTQHALGGARLYGLIPVRTTMGAAWAPLINGNFDVFLVAGMLPAVVGGLVRGPAIDRPWTWVHGLAAVGGLGLLVYVAALGPLVGLGAAALVAVGRAITPRSRWLGSLLAVAYVTGGIVLGLTLPRWAPDAVEASLSQRVEQWSGTLALLRDNLVLGVGPGGYATAFPPYAPPLRFVRHDHVHSDLLEALVEVGLVGVLLVAIALLLVPRSRARSLSHRGTWIELGLVVWLGHSLVDFPLHLPGLALVAAAAAATRVVGWSAPTRLPPTLARAALVALAALQLLAAAWTGHAAWVGHLADRLARDESDTASLAWMERVAPWRLEPSLVRARAAARDGDSLTARSLAERVVAQAPHDANLLLQAGAVLAHIRALEQADAALARAIARHAADHRPRALASRVAQARGDSERATVLWAAAVQRWPYELAVEQRPFVRALELQPLGLWWVDQLDDGAAGYLLVLLGGELLTQGDPESALVAFERAADLEPYLAHTPLRGVALVQIGFVDQGLAQLAEADEHDTNGWARRLRARTLMGLGRPGEARDDAKRALMEDPGNAESLLLRIRSEAAVDGPLAALDLGGRLLGTPEAADPTVALALARLGADNGVFSECVRWLGPHQGRLSPDGLALMHHCESERIAGGGTP